MCFRNLPIEFDAQGAATLRGGPDPFGYQAKTIDRDAIKNLLGKNGYVKAVDKTSFVTSIKGRGLDASFAEGEQKGSTPAAPPVRK